MKNGVPVGTYNLSTGQLVSPIILGSGYLPSQTATMYKDGVPMYTVYLASGIRVPILPANYYNYSQNPKVSASSGGLAAMQQYFNNLAVQQNMLYFSATTTNAERALWDSLWKDTIPNMSFSQVVDTWLGMTIDSQIDLSEPEADYSAYSFAEEDVCLIGVPSFGGRVPSIVLERLRQTRANGAMAVVVVVFGNRTYDDTLLELKNEASACGYKVGAAVAAVAEHSIMRQYGEGRPDAQDEMELRQFSKEIAKLITNRENAKDFTVPGNSAYREYKGVPFKPKADKACTKCGLCAEKCPVQAIPEDNPASVDEKKCISCMRCIVVCLQNARKLNKAVLFTASQAMKKAFEGRKQNELYL